MGAEDLNEDKFRERFDAGESLEALGFDLDKAITDEPLEGNKRLRMP